MSCLKGQIIFGGYVKMYNIKYYLNGGCKKLN